VSENNGVVVYRTTRLTMIEAVRSAHPAPAGRLRRNKRLSHTELADAILLNLAPEAEPASLKAVAEAERIIGERDEEIAGLRLDIAARAEAFDLLREADSAKYEAVERLLGQRERANRVEAELARVADALRPLAKLKGPTIADRTRVVAQILASLDVPAADAEVTP
jgi:hypothetical protein